MIYTCYNRTFAREQELSVSVLCECKHSAFVAQLTITVLPYGTDISQKCPFPWERDVMHGSLGPPKSSQITSRLV